MERYHEHFILAVAFPSLTLALPALAENSEALSSALIINTASGRRLPMLQGVRANQAQAIVEYREAQRCLFLG